MTEATGGIYLVYKLIHVLAVIAFMGNITTGLFWHMHAMRTRDPKILAHTMAGIIRSDRIFTVPGVIVIVLAGVAGAMRGNFPIWGTDWIRWALILFAISGAAFMRVAPLQRKLLAVAQAGASQAAGAGAQAGASGGTGASGGASTFDEAAYRRLTRQWEIWGAIALLTPLAALVLMVLKPNS